MKNKLQIILLLSLIVTAAFGVYYYLIPWLSSQPVRQIGEKSVITVPEGKKVRRMLYFSLNDRLVQEEREIPLRSDEFSAQIKDILMELIKGPLNDLRLTTLIPEETKIKSIFIDSNGICYLNFGKEIQERFPGGAWTELLSLYSIVNTLSNNFPEINGVQILVEGYGVETLAGHIDTRYPLQRREDLVGQ